MWCESIVVFKKKIVSYVIMEWKQLARDSTKWMSHAFKDIKDLSRAFSIKLRINLVWIKIRNPRKMDNESNGLYHSYHARISLPII